MRARRRRARRDLAPGRTRAVVLFVCVLALLFAKFAFSAETWPEDDAAADSTKTGAAAGAAAAGDAKSTTPPPPSTRDSETADSLIRAARVAADEKRFDAAAENLRRALVLRPGDRTAWSLLARVLSWDRKFDASIATYRDLLAAHPDDAFDRAGYARVLSWSGRYEESIAEFRRAAAADSTNLETRLGLARVRSWSGDLPGAAIEYGRILRANPSYGDAWLGRATIERWRGAATAADRDAAKAAALGADADALAEERRAIDRALAPSTTAGVTTSHERQRASGAPDFTIEESGPFGAARATLGRAVGVGARVAATRLFERNTRTAAGDTTLNYDLDSRSLRLDASFLRGYPVQASVAGEWRRFEARSAKVLYPRNGGDEFTGWNARVWGFAGRWTPGVTARRTFLALKEWHAPTGTLRFEPGHLTDVEGTLDYQWNARGTASLAGTRGETSDDNRRWRAAGTVGYRLRLARPNVRLDYGLAFADWDRRSPSYFTPLSSTRHAGGISFGGYAEPGAVEYGARYELSHLASSNFEDIVAHAFSGYLNGTLADRFPLGLEASYSVDNNDYETWYVGLTGSARW
ncbi:MAG TPA: tetratricopeptide repeat protein [Candidatus Eisenbacteria bacterium]|nr:tetratricopeptide repeat protein [Candidatus Eisenbacteria bacterium]